MKKRIDLHGKTDCPFAWRTRLAAAEKEAPFDWIPCDVRDPDPRVATENPDLHSPLMIHDWLTLTESMVICQYIDEAFPGRRLQNEDPAKRALERLAMQRLDFDFIDDGASESEIASQAKSEFRALDVRLRQGPWLGGEAPSLLDVKVLPLMAQVILKGKREIPKDAERSREYWQRWQERMSYRQTLPPWAGPR